MFCDILSYRLDNIMIASIDYTVIIAEPNLWKQSLQVQMSLRIHHSHESMFFLL